MLKLKILHIFYVFINVMENTQLLNANIKK